jgi:twitching motility protein PilT
VRALIRENKTFRIASDIQTGARFGMIALDAYLMSLVTRGIVTADDALEKSQSPDDFKNRLRENGISYKEY